jgi:hypothetical protein
MANVQPSGVVGIFTCSEPVLCCLCDKPVKLGEFIKRIGDRWADMACVDKALMWMFEAKERKRNAGAAV